MVFNINQFRSQLQFGGAQPNLFEVVMTLPSAVQANQTTFSTKMSFMCRAAEMPGENINVITVDYFGRQTKWPGIRTFDDWTITVINDEDFIVRNAIEKWSSSLNAHVANQRAANAVAASNHSSSAIVRQFGKRGNVIKEIQIVGMFPSVIASMPLDWSSSDQIQDFNVTFAYQWWEGITSDGQLQGSSFDRGSF